jgi:hypothetical protein
MYSCIPMITNHGQVRPNPHNKDTTDLPGPLQILYPLLYMQLHRPMHIHNQCPHKSCGSTILPHMGHEICAEGLDAYSTKRRYTHAASTVPVQYSLSYRHAASTQPLGIMLTLVQLANKFRPHRWNLSPYTKPIICTWQHVLYNDAPLKGVWRKGCSRSEWHSLTKQTINISPQDCSQMIGPSTSNWAVHQSSSNKSNPCRPLSPTFSPHHTPLMLYQPNFSPMLWLSSPVALRLMAVLLIPQPSPRARLSQAVESRPYHRVHDGSI